MWDGLTTSTLEIPPSVPPVLLCMEGLCAPVTSGGLGGPCEISSSNVYYCSHVHFNLLSIVNIIC